MVLTAAELDRLCVVLVNSRNPLNIGASARAMANFGCRHLRVVHPYDPAFREARSAVDAEPVLTAAEEFEDVAAAVADCSLVVGTTAGTRRTPQDTLHPLEAAAAVIRQHLVSGSKVAVLFGSEKVGLSNQDLRHCQLLLRIPTHTAVPSMNLAQAVAVVLYEMIRQTAAEAASVSARVPAIDTPLATAGERERLISVLLELLSLSGYTRRRPAIDIEEKVRRLVRHLTFTRADLSEWLGLLRQLLWKLRG